ncbi:hypothetical protein RYX36_008629 [Vicia faba]
MENQFKVSPLGLITKVNSHHCTTTKELSEPVSYSCKYDVSAFQIQNILNLLDTEKIIDAENEKNLYCFLSIKYHILKIKSFPRVTFHPLFCLTMAKKLGKVVP